MCNHTIVPKTSIFSLIIAFLFLNNGSSSEMRSATPVFDVTDDSMKVSISNPFNLKCTGLHSLIWEFEILSKEILRIEFPQESVSHRAGKLFYELVFSSEVSLVSTRTYSCDFISPAGKVAASLCLFVKGMGEPHLYATNNCSSKVEVGLNEMVELFCYVNELDEANVKWYYNKKPLLLPNNSQKLPILKVDGQHSGLYECQAENKPIHTIIRATYVSEPNTLVETNGGDTTKISCSANEDSPLPEITWYSSGSEFGNSLEEKLSDPSPDDMEYFKFLFFKFYSTVFKNESDYHLECEMQRKTATWKLKGNTTSFEMRGVSIYKTNMKSSMMVADINKELKLFCYSKGIPQPHVTWYRNNETLTEDVNRVKFENDSMQLVITQLGKEDSGLYECSAENEVLAVPLSTMLIVNGDAVSGKMGCKENAVLLFCVVLVFLL